MQTTKRFLTVARRRLTGLGLVVGGLWLAGTAAHGQSAGATVVGVLGQVSAAFAEQGTMAIRGGMNLPAGATVKTGPHSAVDLDLGSVAGVIRLAENTTLKLEKVANTGPGVEPVLSLELRLLEGTLLGNSRKIPATANFEVKVSNGIVGIDQGQYRISSQGIVVLLDGSLAFAHVAKPGDEPQIHLLKAPPAVYFSPVEKIRPAPPVLVREVFNQTRSKLPKK
jgi:hypothetical protein